MSEPKLPEFKLITLKQIISGAVARYNKTYAKQPKSYSDEEWAKFEENKAKLNALENPTCEQIVEIVPESWVQLECNGCGVKVNELVTITTRARWSVSLCETCLSDMQDQLL